MFAPTLVHARRIEHAFNVAIQRFHHVYPGEHRWSVMFSNQHERLHRGLPFIGIVFFLGQLHDLLGGIAERDQRFPARQLDRIEKSLIPQHQLYRSFPKATPRNPRGRPYGVASAFRYCDKFSKIAQFIVNRVPGCRYDASRYLPCKLDDLVPQSAKASAATYRRWDLQMIEQSMDGLLFFRGAREVRECVAYDVIQTSARICSDGLGLLPIEFYVTFDNFRTVGRCRLIWRYRDDFNVSFERWLAPRAHVAVSDSDPA